MGLLVILVGFPRKQTLRLGLSGHNLFGRFSETGRGGAKMIREGQAANTGYVIKLAITEANGNNLMGEPDKWYQIHVSELPKPRTRKLKPVSHCLKSSPSSFQQLKGNPTA